MGDFFYGWRRKAGMATLVLACLFLGAWGRSFASTNDHFTVWKNHSVYSHNGSVCWNIRYDDLSTADASPNPAIPKINSRWELCGVVVSDISFHRIGMRQYWVTYWYLMTPLTLLAGFLLLSQPRRTNRPAAAPPNENRLTASDDPAPQ